jgi:uncharacterized protein (TIGR02328 family)
MRLWHQSLIPYLPNAQLSGQHRECCALRGKGWGRKHATVDYVFTHPYMDLFNYHHLIMFEGVTRGSFEPAEEWELPSYRGKQLGYDDYSIGRARTYPTGLIYHEHNDDYLRECLDNLHRKGFLDQVKERLSGAPCDTETLRIWQLIDAI